MRGKKIDNDFLGNFISQCATSGAASPDEILLKAKIEISLIDDKIKEVETLKIKRSKLLDVVTIFGEKLKNKPSKEVEESLPYFNIQNQHICKFLCDSLKSNSLIIDSIKSNVYSKDDILFCVKQLLEHKIIYRTGECLLRGSKFEEYYKTIVGN